MSTDQRPRETGPRHSRRAFLRAAAGLAGASAAAALLQACGANRTGSNWASRSCASHRSAISAAVTAGAGGCVSTARLRTDQATGKSATLAGSSNGRWVAA